MGCNKEVRLGISCILITCFIFLTSTVASSQIDNVSNIEIDFMELIAREHIKLDLYILRSGSFRPVIYSVEDILDNHDYFVSVSSQTLISHELELTSLEGIALIPLSEGAFDKPDLSIYGEFNGKAGTVFSFGLTYGDDMLVDGQRVRQDKRLINFVRNFVPVAESPLFGLVQVTRVFSGFFNNLFSKE